MKLHPIANQPDWLKVIIYGEIDSGKTTFGTSGTGHKVFGKTLVTNIERGLSSVRWSGAIQTPAIDSMAMMEEVVLGVKSQAGDFEGVHTLVVDSFTDLQRLVIEEISKRDTPTIQEYGARSKYMKRIAALLRDLPCHVIITSFPRLHRDTPDGPVVAYDIEASDSLSRSIKGMFDNVWMLKKTNASADAEASVQMLTRGTGIYYARTRNAEFGELLPPVVTNPTLPMIHEIYTKSLELGRKKAQPNAK